MDATGRVVRENNAVHTQGSSDLALLETHFG
jgi:hypothetical protein